jgi:hypothetical protein
MFQAVMSYHVGCDPGESRVMWLVSAGTESVDDRLDYQQYGSRFAEHLGDEIVGEVLMHVRALLDGATDGQPSDDRAASWDWAWRVERGQVDVDRSVLRSVLFTTLARVLDDPPTALRPVIAADETLTLLRDGLHERYGAGDPASPVTRMAGSLATRWATVVATYKPPDRTSAE